MAAIGGRQVEIAATEHGVRRIEREIIVDPQLGLAAEKETVTVAVDVGDGNIAVAQQERVRVIGTQPGYRSQPAALPYKPAPSYGSTRPASGYQSYPATHEPSEMNHCVHCIICIFCPCWIFVWLFLCCVYGC